jgi:hypothetical protein
MYVLCLWHVPIHIHICIYAHIYICTSQCQILADKRARKCAKEEAEQHTHTHTHTYIHTYIHTAASNIIYIYKYIYIYTYTHTHIHTPQRQILADKRARKRAKEEAEQRLMFDQAFDGQPTLKQTQSGLDTLEDMLDDDEDDDDDENDNDFLTASSATETTGRGSTTQDVCVLVDNGSSRAASTLSLRDVARRLEERMGVRVIPTSLKHSDKASLSALGGEPAVLFDQLLQAVKNKAQSESESGLRQLGDLSRVANMCVLPVFFGPSAALTALVPEASSAGLNVRFAKHLGAGDEGVRMIASSMVQEIRGVLLNKKLVKPPVILVDHGSPSRDVVALRDAVAAELRLQAVDSAGLAGSVRAASMERKPGEQFAFADPLLDVALRDLVAAERPSPDVAAERPSPDSGDVAAERPSPVAAERPSPDSCDASGMKQDLDVVLCMMFLGPGTHAGEGGDIDQICAGVPGVRVHKTRLFGQCAGLVDILERRYKDAQ